MHDVSPHRPWPQTAVGTAHPQGPFSWLVYIGVAVDFPLRKTCWSSSMRPCWYHTLAALFFSTPIHTVCVGRSGAPVGAYSFGRGHQAPFLCGISAHPATSQRQSGARMLH
jgi:hypothetical protein